MPEVRPPRRHDLDALRAFAMLLGIGLHGALSFMPAPWIVQDRSQSSLFALVVTAIHGFRMPLFFLLSGFFTAMLWQRRGLDGLVRHRVRRIVVPLLLGCLTIVPLMWAVVIWAGGQSSAYAPDAAGRDVWTAAAYGRMGAVERFVDAGVDLDRPDAKKGQTPLAWAVVGDHPDVVSFLLESGADPNARFAGQSTALHTAALFGRFECARRLVEAGADVRATNAGGRTPLDSSRLDQRRTEAIAAVLRVTIDFPSVERGRVRVRTLLEGEGAGAGGDDATTAKDLWTAAAYGNLAAVKRFVEAGADVDQADPLANQTPLAWAVIGDQPEVVTVLLESGASPNALDGQGSAALHTASFFGRVECAKRLIRGGADRGLQNANGESPLDSGRHDRATTEFIAGLLKVPIDFDAVTEGRNQVRSLLTASDGEGPSKGEADSGDTLDGPGAVLSAAVARPTRFPFFSHLWFLYFLCWLLAGFALVVGLVRLLHIPAPPAWAIRSPVAWLWIVPLTLVPQLAMHFGGALPGFGPDTSAGLLPLPHVLLYYGIFFGFGALYHNARDDDGRLGRFWWALVPTALVVALPLGLALSARTPWALEITGGESARRLLSALFQVVYAWLMVFGLMGLFRRFLVRERPSARYLSDASYWLYLAHLPLIVVAQALVQDWPLPAVLKFTLLLAGVTALLLVTYRYWVRYTWLGRLLNGPRKRPERDVASP